MKQSRGILLTLIILLLAGCNNNGHLLEEQKNQLKQLNNKIVELENTIEVQQKIIDEHNKEFSYLHGLSEDELEAYNSFIQERDTIHLVGISPEKIVLIYYHSIVIDDIETIYTLTFDDGTLPDYSSFSLSYYKEGHYQKELESTLDFRDYQFIRVKDDIRTEDEVAVEMKVSLGTFQHMVILGMKKQNEIWKKDIEPLTDRKNN